MVEVKVSYFEIWNKIFYNKRNFFKIKYIFRNSRLLMFLFLILLTVKNLPHFFYFLLRQPSFLKFLPQDVLYCLE